jgi:ATP-dependent RNA helicase DeaD
MVILDEADEMLNMGFREDIDIILEKVPDEKQTVLFSATMPKGILDLTKKYQKKPKHIKIAHKELTVSNTEQFYLETSKSSKLDVLSKLIDANDIKLSLVFCNTKKKVDELTSNLQSRGYSAEALHGDMRQEQRDKVMSLFRKGQCDILIATDVAARGIDVDDVEAVFNYDIPNDDEYYVHRIGRTGRAGKSGKAFTFVTRREIYKLKDIQRYTKSVITRINPPTLIDIEEKKIGKILNSLKDTISEGKHSKYISYIERVLEDINVQSEEGSFISTLDAAAALLKILSTHNGTQSDTLNNDVYDEKDHSQTEPGMVRLFINIGSKHKIQPKHIVESIASSTNLPGKLIGAIDIYDKYTFVEVPRVYSAEVMDAMKSSKLKGRRINIEKSNKPRKSKKFKKRV